MLTELRSGLAALLLATTALTEPRAQEVTLRTNLLYLATTTPNLGAEWRIDQKYTVSMAMGYNSFRFGQYTDKAGNTVNPKLRHWMATAELRRWLCEPFMGWNVGVQLLGGEYNAGGIKFLPALKEGRYKGWAAGAGVTGGYQFPLSRKWSLDLSIGLGYIYTRYRKYDCYTCGEEKGHFRKNYLGPTKAAVSIVYMLD